MNYRPEVDGLRAIAILGVVAYHVGLEWFPGGFLGVDVFFVISGYLITSLILTEYMDKGAIDLGSFFVRRIRRLLPAYTFVLAASVLLGFLVLAPIEEEQGALSRSAITSALYISNYLFPDRTGGYFDHDATMFPLLHTWSLSVEVQFYILSALSVYSLPLVMRKALGKSRARMSKRAIQASIAGAVILSTIASIGYCLHVGKLGEREEEWAFFMLQARLYEFGFGSILALPLASAGQNRRGWICDAIAGLGLAAIVYAFATTTEEQAVPEFEALFATGGAAAVLYGCTGGRVSILRYALSALPLRAIGLVSYSWYLWHWPLLTLVRMREIGEESLPRDSLVAAISFVLACLTYVYIEKPARAGFWRACRSPQIATATFASVAVLCGLGGAMLLNVSRLQDDARFLTLARVKDERSWLHDRCFHDKPEYKGELIPIDSCVGPVPSDKKLVVVWGDSHADHFAPMVEGAVDQRRFAILPRTMGTCPPIFEPRPFLPMEQGEKCKDFNQRVYAEIERLITEGRLAAVLLASRWTSVASSFNRFAGTEYSPFPTNGEQGKRLSLVRQVADRVKQITSNDIPIILLAPIPDLQYQVPSCLARHSVDWCSVTRDEDNRNRQKAMEILNTAAQESALARIWDPQEHLCNSEWCLVQSDKVVFYKDKRHLSLMGSRWLSQFFAPELNRVLEGMTTVDRADGRPCSNELSGCSH